MALTPEQIEDRFNIIISKLEDGFSLRKALKEDNVSSHTFYEWLEDSELGEVKRKRYACACEARADAIFEEIIDIADDSSRDHIETENGTIQNTEFVNRSRLKVDARKWIVSKLNPKKYGDKLDVTSLGEKVSTPFINVDPFNNDTDDNGTS